MKNLFKKFIIVMLLGCSLFSIQDALLFKKVSMFEDNAEYSAEDSTEVTDEFTDDVNLERSGLEHHLYDEYSYFNMIKDEDEDRILYLEIVENIDHFDVEEILFLAETLYDYDYIGNVTRVIEYVQKDYPQLELLNLIDLIYNEKSSFSLNNELVYNIKIKRINDRLQDLVSEVNEEADLETKYKIIYTWICSNIVFEHTDNCRNIYGAIVEGKAVCDGVSDACKYICNLCGLPCIEVSGYVYGDESCHHRWVIVPNNHQFYLLDPTWDLGKKPEDYEFFMKEDLFISDRWTLFEKMKGYYSIPEYKFFRHKDNLFVNSSDNELYLEFVFDEQDLNNKVFINNDSQEIVVNSNSAFKMNSNAIIEAIIPNDTQSEFVDSEYIFEANSAKVSEANEYTIFFRYKGVHYNMTIDYERN